MDSESNFDSVLHGAKYGELDADQIEKEIARKEKKLKKMAG